MHCILATFWTYCRHAACQVLRDKPWPFETLCTSVSAQLLTNIDKVLLE